MGFPKRATAFCIMALGDLVIRSVVAPSRSLKDAVNALLEYVGGASLLLFETLRWLGHSSSWRGRRILTQMERIGWGSLPIVSFISLTIGVAVAFQTAYQMQKFSFSTQIYTASFASLMIFREIGPVLTALIVAGRVGASITAELGTMVITQQIDALRALATNPIRFLVVPRFLALFIALPLLTVYADAIGVLGGYLVGVTQLHIGSQLYFEMSTMLLALKDLGTGLIKALVFAVIICAISCYEGLRTVGGAEGVGRATTWSVVVSFTLIIAADSFFTAIFYFIGQ
jgi:phospholipid/cholesterol/gamma-HCH transport system permease protein